MAKELDGERGSHIIQATLTDEVYRGLAAAGFMPKITTCAECGGVATFRDDFLAARYECECGHAMAAMWADLAPTIG